MATDLSRSCSRPPGQRPVSPLPSAGFELFAAISLIVLIIILPINCTGGEVDKLMSNPVGKAVCLRQSS